MKFGNAFDLGALDYLENFEKPVVEAILNVLVDGTIFIKNHLDNITSSLMI
jgi:hypothetical protein